MNKNKSKIYHKSINGFYIAWGVFFVLYQILSSAFMPMPILLGFFFCYMFVLLLQHQSSLYELDFRWYFCLFYLLMIDITHNFYIFSSWIAFVVFFYFCADWLRINFKVGKLIPALFVCCAYVLVYCIDGLLTYIDNGDLKIFSKEYFYYILLESLLATLFFKDELR